MAAAPILSWEGLGLIQGSGWLFRDLDIAIAPRDRLALIGRNGAGKSTLLRLIAGTVDADQGYPSGAARHADRHAGAGPVLHRP